MSSEIATPNGDQVRTAADQPGSAPQATPAKPPPADASPPAGTPEQPDRLTDSEESLLAKLDGLWRQHQAAGLAVRHEMGTLLNAELGPPAERQPRGQ